MNELSTKGIVKAVKWKKKIENGAFEKEYISSFVKSAKIAIVCISGDQCC